MKKAFLIPALLLLAASAATAQTKNPVSSALRDILPGRQKNTIAAVEAMPADKFNYKPTPDQMPFGHLVAHMIGANYTLCSGAAAVPAPKVEEAKESDPKDKLVVRAQGLVRFLRRLPREDGRLKASRDDGGLPRTRGFARLGQHGPGQQLGRPLCRSRNVPASEWGIAADREEVICEGGVRSGSCGDGRLARPGPTRNSQAPLPHLTHSLFDERL